jgi:NEDD8-activating enzyme E1 regulatory subunit
MACAVREFFKECNVMPLSGTLPDMKAQSSDYIELQNIYKSKATKDINLVVSHVRSLERAWPSRKPISERDIAAFCKNAQYMQMIPERHIERKPRVEFDVKFSEYPTESEIKGNSTILFTLFGRLILLSVSQLRENRYATLLYLAFAAYEQFFYTYKRKPGDSDLDGDAETLKSLMLVLFKQLLTTENFEQEDLDAIEQESTEICEEM